MTYAMRHPVSFGEYFLDGSFTIWKEELKRRYYTDLTDEEKATYGIEGPGDYAQYAQLKFKYPVASENNGFRGLPSLKDYELPTEFTIQFETARSYGDLIVLSSKLMAVTEELKAIIEELEPDVHQFWQIDVIHADGAKLPDTYYAVRVGAFKKTFLPEQTPPKILQQNSVGHYLLNFTLNDCKKLTFSKAKIGASHLWCEVYLKFPELFLSDILLERIKAAGLRVPNAHQVSMV